MLSSPAGDIETPIRGGLHARPSTANQSRSEAWKHVGSDNRDVGTLWGCGLSHVRCRPVGQQGILDLMCMGEGWGACTFHTITKRRCCFAFCCVSWREPSRLQFGPPHKSTVAGSMQPRLLYAAWKGVKRRAAALVSSSFAPCAVSDMLCTLPEGLQGTWGCKHGRRLWVAWCVSGRHLLCSSSSSSVPRCRCGGVLCYVTTTQQCCE